MNKILVHHGSISLTNNKTAATSGEDDGILIKAVTARHI